MSKHHDQFSAKPQRDMRDDDRRETRRGSFNKKLAHKRLEVEMKLSEAWERGARMMSRNHPWSNSFD